METASKIYIAGHTGLVGSAIVRALQKAGYRNLLLRTRQELELLDEPAVQKFFRTEKPNYVFLAAAKVGGILANSTRPAEFIYENLQIQNHIIRNAHLTGVKKLLFLGSSCVYPKNSPQPIKEQYLLTGPFEETNQAYAVAKVAGIITCQSYHRQYGANFIAVMPTNTYGPGDNFDPLSSHAIAGIMQKMHEAKKQNAAAVKLWGTGQPKREFIFVDDFAAACVFLMNQYNEPEIINLGAGQDLSIAALAEMIKNVVGYDGEIQWDKTKPDGMPRKLLDVSKLTALGWQATTTLEQGLRITYQWYLEQERI